MHDLVQQHGEIEDREPLDDRERHPDERVRETDQSVRREAKHHELPGRDGEMPRG
jgi:hypothetical protein